MQTGNDTVQQDWNIVVITSDEHNAKIMGCAGHPIIKTPAIDRLAREGTLFTKAYCAYPICAPTRQSFITGRYPKEHGQLSNSYVFDKRNETWAHHFKKHGYTTACIGKMHTNHEDFEYGYDYRYSKNSIPEEIHQARKENPSYYDPEDEKVFATMTDSFGKRSRFTGKVVRDGNLEHDGVMTMEALRYLHAHKEDKFFVHISLTQPHWPWDSPQRFYYMYDPAAIDLPKAEPGELEQNNEAWKKFVGMGWNQNTDEHNRVCRARYYGSISWMDYNIGKILDTLDELDLTRRTLVIYFSDHGDMAGEKGLWLKQLMYDSSARVPMVIRMPGIVPAGAENAQLINHVDLFPTLAGLVGAAADLPEILTGTDYSAVVKGEAEGPEYTFSMAGIDADWNTLPKQLMVRSERWKLILYDVEDPRKRYVLYDMENDPEERTNLAYKEDCRDIVLRHRDAIDRFSQSLRKPLFELSKMNKRSTEED
jgi:choline-sulfatase